MSSLALPAFVAFAASTLSLQSYILSGCVSSDNDFLQSCLLSWSALFGNNPEILPPKQPFWDHSGVLADKTVESSLLSPHSRLSFLAACTQHTGDWLFALSIASCGLQLDNEAMRVAVGLKLGLDLCLPHECRCQDFLAHPVFWRGAGSRLWPVYRRSVAGRACTCCLQASDVNGAYFQLCLTGVVGVLSAEMCDQ